MSAPGTVMPAPNYTCYDLDGLPAAGGLLEVYAAGTSTPLTVYKDAAMLVAHTNPVVLDSAGRASIFLAPGFYKFIQRTSLATGATIIYTQDNVSSTHPFAIDFDINGTAGENILAGQVAYLSQGQGGLTPGKWYLTDSDLVYASSGAEVVAIAQEPATANGPGIFRVQGRSTVVGPLQIGKSYYVAPTAGAVITPPPLNDRLVGIADTTTTIVTATGFGARVFVGPVSVDGVLTVTGGVSLSNSPDNVIHTDTSDGADAKSITITGGGAPGLDRASLIRVFGNEAANPGELYLGLGDKPTASISFYTSTGLIGKMFRTGGFAWGTATDPGANNLRVAGNVNTGSLTTAVATITDVTGTLHGDVVGGAVSGTTGTFGSLGSTPLDATKLTGTVNNARLSADVLTHPGGYTGSTSNFLRGDGTFIAPTGVVPITHHVTHEVGGNDQITGAMSVSSITSPTASFGTLGATPLPAANLTGTVPDAQLSVNVLKYPGGYPGGAIDFLRSDGTWSTPAGGAGGLVAHHTTHEPGGTDVLLNNAWTNTANTFTALQTINNDLSFNATGKVRWGAAVSGDPMLKRNGATIEARNGTDAAFAILRAQFTGGDITSGTIPMARLSFSASPRLLGRGTAGAGTAEEVTLGPGLTMTGTTLNVSSVATTFQQGHTWGLLGDLTLLTIVPSMFVPMTVTQIVKLVSIRVKIATGTSITVQVRRNGLNVGSQIVVTPTAATTTLGNVVLANNDELTLVLSDPVGNPVTLSATLVLEYTP